MVNGKWLPDFIERLKASAWHQLYLPLLPFTTPDPSPSTLTVLNSNFLQLGRRSGGRSQPTRNRKVENKKQIKTQKLISCWPKSSARTVWIVRSKAGDADAC